jgi:DNA repair protein RecO (recombination protein O)
MAVVTDALVLKRFDFSETSQIGHFYTAEWGRIAALAKGIKRPNAALRGPMDLFHLARVRLQRRPSSDLALVERYEPLTIFPHLREHRERMMAAFYLTELAALGTQELDSDPELFRLLTGALALLEATPPAFVLPVITAIELRYLSRLGFEPALERCAKCDAPAAAARHFYPLEGGVVCSACRPPGSVGYPLDHGLAAVLDVLHHREIRIAARLRLDYRQALVLRELVGAYVNAVLERAPHSQRFLVLPARSRRSAPRRGAPARR